MVALILLLKIAVVIFVAGNLLEMGLRLNPKDALRGLRSVRFVVHTIFWGFVAGPAVAYGITKVFPLDQPYAIGLILMGMAPCAPFVPMLATRAHGDLGFTAALMLVLSAGTVVFMPVAVPLMITGMSVSAWAVARPLVIIIFVPLAIGMAILRGSASVASGILPVVKKTTGLFTVAVIILCFVIYGRGLLGTPGSFAIASQVVFFSIMTAFPYWFGFGLPHEQKIVLTVGLATRNLGAAFAPLLSAPDIDQRATVMVVLALPMMVASALLGARWFGGPAPKTDAGWPGSAATQATGK